MRQFGATSDTSFPAITTASAHSGSNKPKKHKTTAGKVILAAIVHHDTINELVANQSSDHNHQQKQVNEKNKTIISGGAAASNNRSDKFETRVDNEKTSSKVRKEIEKEKKKKKGNREIEGRNKQTKECISLFDTERERETSSTQIRTKIKAAISGCYTHEDGGNNIESRQENSSIIASSGGRRKFSKLFSKKKKTPTAATTTLIDNGYPSSKTEGSNSKGDQQHQIPPTKRNEQENSNHKAAYQEEEVDKQEGNVYEEQQALDEYEKIFENDKEQVIEFKFDLIVNNKESYETATTATRGQQNHSNCYDCDHDNENENENDDDCDCDVNYNVASLDRESKLMNCKLDDNVNELVESFVLDSSDVCFMSTGKQQNNQKLANLNLKLETSTGANVLATDSSCCMNEFDYLNKLFLHTLTYSFQLLEVKKRRKRNTINKLGINNSNNHTSDDELTNLFINNTELNFHDLLVNEHNKYLSSENYSIEVSATLFLNKQSTYDLHQRVGPTETGNDSDDEPHDVEQGPTPTHEIFCNYYIIDLLSNDETYSKQVNDLLSPFDETLSFNKYLAKINCDSKNKSEQPTEQPQPQQSVVLDDPQAASSKFASGMHRIDEQSSIDCLNIEEGLKLTERIRDRLEQLENNLKMNKSKQETTNRRGSAATTIEISSSLVRPTIKYNKLLIIGLKLKEKIDNGLFSNRMCLIDFDPNFIEMHPIFESIFNGQALAYLKRHKLHLKKLESKFNLDLVSNLIVTSNNNSETSAAAAAATTTIGNGTVSSLNFVDKSCFKDDDDLLKQHHQVASQSKLIQAEWILYKQLSSALIRTLMIVHVHRLTNIPPPTTITNVYCTDKIANGTRQDKIKDNYNENRECYEHYLMRENLIVLKFARLIQRASSIRLKRRKRHLKSHLASSNVSISSNASATITTNDIFNNLSMNNNQKEALNFDYYVTPTITSVGGNCYSPHMCQNEAGNLLGITVDSPPNLAMRNSKKRVHSNSHSRHHQQNHNQQQLYYSQSRRTSSGKSRYYNAESMSPLKAFQYNCQQSDFAATESSSMSTSSGSQTRRIQSSRSSRRRDLDDLRDNFVNNYSDSDSITSANLNSCSSSSFSHLKHSSLSHASGRHPHNYHQHRSTSKQRRLRRDIELKWIAKQSSSRAMIHEQQLLHHHHHPYHYHNEQSPTHIELTNFKMSPTRRCSSVSRVLTTPSKNSSQVIQIDCSPTNTDNNLSSLSLQHLEDPNSNSRTLINGNDTTSVGIEDNTDNASDICSIVAEPPKQLKLEEFLNQLSSIIAPSSKSKSNIQDKFVQNNSDSSSDLNSTTTTTLVESMGSIQDKKKDFQGESEVPNGRREDFGNLTEMICINRAQQQMATNRFELDVDSENIHSSNDLSIMTKPSDTPFVQMDQDNTTVNEDDEDCKSHSSILEQLSSLALESNTRLNNRNLHQQYNYTPSGEQHNRSDGNNFRDCRGQFATKSLVYPTSDNPSMEKPPCNQQLGLIHQSSRIPKTTGHLQKLLYNSSQLPRKISQSCVTDRDHSSVEERLKALSISCQAPPASPSVSSSGAFTLSTDSSCSSSSCSAENNTNRGTRPSNKTVSPSTNQTGTTVEQYLYASVIRSHQNVNI